jgi:hypothetical protein
MNRAAIIIGSPPGTDSQFVQESVLLEEYLDKFHFDSNFFSSEKNTEIYSRLAVTRGIRYFHDIVPMPLEALFFIGQFNSDLIESGIQTIVNEFYSLKKPIAFIGKAVFIATDLIANPILSAGLWPQHILLLEKKGAVVRQANYDDVVVDTINNLYSTPGFNENASISEAAQGIEKIVSYIHESLSKNDLKN